MTGWKRMILIFLAIATIIVLPACGGKSPGAEHTNHTETNNDLTGAENNVPKLSVGFDDVGRMDYSTISSYGGTTMVIDNDGTLWGWGSNQYGKLLSRDTSVEDVTSPEVIMHDILSVSVASNYVLAIDKDHNLLGWGAFDSSLVVFSSREPIRLIDSKVKAACAGDNGAVVILEDGSLLNLDFDNRSTDLIMTDTKSVAMRWNHTLALKTDGTLWAWGSNRQGQLGTHPDNCSDVHSSNPRFIMENVSAIYAGDENSYAITEDGTVWAWGNVALDVPREYDMITLEEPTPIFEDAVSVYSVGSLTYIIKNDGALWGWGSNSFGVLGNGKTTGDSVEYKSYQASPVKIAESVLAVTSNGNMTFFLTTAGEVFAMGANIDGTCLGDSSLGNDIYEIAGVEIEIQTVPAKIVGNIALPSPTETLDNRSVTSNLPFGNGSSTGSSDDSVTNDFALYAQVFDNYSRAEALSKTEWAANGINELCQYYDFSCIGYAMIDVDGVGADELLIGEIGSADGTFFDLYTISEDIPVLIAASSERTGYYLCDNGFIENIEHRDSIDDLISVHNFYRIDSTDGTLIPVEAVIYDPSSENSGPWFYALTDSYSASTYTEISGVEAEEVILGYCRREIQFAPIPVG